VGRGGEGNLPSQGHLVQARRADGRRRQRCAARLDRSRRRADRRLERRAPRDDWIDIALLAERLAPTPRLIPDDVDERARVFGLGRELCGELGLGWCRRLSLVHQLMQVAPDLPITQYLASRYGYDASVAEQAPARVAAILRAFAAQLAAQRAAGRHHLVGDSLTALDIWWAAFAAMIQPLPHELCPMRRDTRMAYTPRDAVVLDAADPALLEHRDFVYREHLELPVRL
jgi:glutathione S-transferase